MPVPGGSVPDETKEPFTAVGDPLQPFELMPFWRLLANAAQDFPDRTAIIYKDFEPRHRELNSIVERTTAGLQQLGIRPGDRVGVCMPNHPAAVVMLYATMRAGATVVMMSPVYAVPALAGQARDGGLTAIATLDEASLLEKITAVASAAGVGTIIVAPATSSPLDEVDYGGSAHPGSANCDPVTAGRGGSQSRSSELRTVSRYRRASIFGRDNRCPKGGDANACRICTRPCVNSSKCCLCWNTAAK